MIVEAMEEAKETERGLGETRSIPMVDPEGTPVPWEGMRKRRMRWMEK